LSDNAGQKPSSGPEDVAPEAKEPTIEAKAKQDLGARLLEVLAQIEAERTRADDLQKKMLYLRADFENYRKRVNSEVEARSRSHVLALISDLLVFADELELAVGATTGGRGAKRLKAGVRMALDKLYKTLEQHGVTRISSRGHRFDPRLHEALERVPSEAVPEGEIVEEVRAGFMLGDKVIRPSLVKISCAPTKEEEREGVKLEDE